MAPRFRQRGAGAVDDRQLAHEVESEAPGLRAGLQLEILEDQDVLVEAAERVEHRTRHGQADGRLEQDAALARPPVAPVEPAREVIGAGDRVPGLRRVEQDRPAKAAEPPDAAELDRGRDQPDQEVVAARGGVGVDEVQQRPARLAHRRVAGGGGPRHRAFGDGDAALPQDLQGIVARRGVAGDDLDLPARRRRLARQGVEQGRQRRGPVLHGDDDAQAARLRPASRRCCGRFCAHGGVMGRARSAPA